MVSLKVVVQHNFLIVTYAKLSVVPGGIDVDYALPLQGFPSGLTTVWHLLLLWTGDHVAQCEIPKGLFCGKSGCHFCHLVGKLKTVNIYNHERTIYSCISSIFQVREQIQLDMFTQIVMKQLGDLIPVDSWRSWSNHLVKLIRKKGKASDRD